MPGMQHVLWGGPPGPRRSPWTRSSRLALALLILCHAAPAQDPPEQILRQAITMHQAGDTEGAIREYREYLKLRPDSPDVRSNLGAALSASGRYSEAIVEYQAALQHGPKDPRIWLNLALAFYKAGQISDAARELEALHAVQPANAQVVLVLADCWLRQGANAKVIGLLAPLDKPDQGDLAIAYMLGTALLRDKQIVRGQIIIDRILRNGDSAEARLLLGMAKLEALEYPAAIADLTKAVELNPHLPDLYSYLGQAQMASGDMPAARAAFEKELAQNPNDFESNLRLAVLLKQDGEYDRARELLARALRIRPGDDAALYQVGATDLAAGDMERACATLEKVVKQAPLFLEAHVSLAQVYYRLKRKADGDRERALVQKLKAEKDAKQVRGDAK
jgi:tetratricopeptide (TPR) repeat protein